MRSLHSLPALVVMGFLTMSAQAQQGPAAESKPSVAKDCTGLKGQALRECQKVARQVEESAKSPQPAEAKKSPTASPPNHIHHSSPVMTTKEEQVVSDAREQGKDPRKELEKLKKRSNAEPTPAQPSPPPKSPPPNSPQ